MRMNIGFRHVYPDNKIREYIQNKMKGMQRVLKNMAEIDLQISADNHQFHSVLLLSANGKDHAFRSDHANPYVAINELFMKAKRWVVDKKDKKIHDRKVIHLPVHRFE